MSIENNGGIISTGESSDSSIRARGQSHQQSCSSKAGLTGEGNYEFGLPKYLCSYFEEFFNMP
jgi:hypothetical protein